jgi:hypothetical protein
MADPKDKAIVKWYEGLKTLNNGSGWVWHPEQPNEIFQEIQFRKRTTLHATREYFQGVGKTPLTLQDISDYLDKYKKIFTPAPTTRPPPVRNFEAPSVSYDGITYPIAPAPGEAPLTPVSSGTEKVAIKQDYSTYELRRDHVNYVIPDSELTTCFATEHLAKQSGNKIDYQCKSPNQSRVVDIVREHRLAVCIILVLLLSAWYLHI